MKVKTSAEDIIYFFKLDGNFIFSLKITIYKFGFKNFHGFFENFFLNQIKARKVFFKPK